MVCDGIPNPPINKKWIPFGTHPIFTLPPLKRFWYQTELHTHQAKDTSDPRTKNQSPQPMPLQFGGCVVAPNPYGFSTHASFEQIEVWYALTRPPQSKQMEKCMLVDTAPYLIGWGVYFG